MNNNRREFIKKSASLAALSYAGIVSAGMFAGCKSSVSGPGTQSQNNPQWPVIEGPGTPKLSMVISQKASVEEMKQLKQLGVNWVHMGGPGVPWTVESLKEIMDRFSAEGLSISNMMIGGISNSVYGRPERDEDIRKIQDSLEAAGKAGLPVVEYNFYVTRFMGGYYLKEGRGGSGMTAFKKSGQDAPPVENTGTFTEDQLWANLEYFLKKVIPVAEKAGVRLAVHPNDPPLPVSHGSPQILKNFNDWKRLFDLVDSPFNGMTYDCGVTREIGEDPLEVLKYMGNKDRVNHIHFRNVTVQKPSEEYVEVFYDEGQVNMFAIMKEIFRQGYTRAINPEHPRALNYDLEHPRGITTWRQYPGGGGYAGEAYDVGYTRAMMQAVMSV